MTGGSRSTVLVVDDESAIRLLCRVNLELDGWDVLEAATLPEARERLDEASVDVVVLDLHLGGRVSHSLIAECGSRTPPIPVALVTGAAEADVATKAGADAVLPKPFEIEQLTQTVRSLAARGESSG